MHGIILSVFFGIIVNCSMEWEDLDEQQMVEAAAKWVDDSDDVQQTFECSLTDEQLMDAVAHLEEEMGEFFFQMVRFKRNKQTYTHRNISVMTSKFPRGSKLSLFDANL